MKNMSLDDFVKKMTIFKKGKLVYKFDPKKGELIWRGKKVRGNRVMLKKKMNFLKTTIPKKDGGDKIILKKGVCFITINLKHHRVSFNATIKLDAPNGLTLNQCLKKCKYLLQFIAVKHWRKLQSIGSDYHSTKEYKRMSEFDSYQVYQNYFIINICM